MKLINNTANKRTEKEFPFVEHKVLFSRAVERGGGSRTERRAIRIKAKLHDIPLRVHEEHILEEPNHHGDVRHPKETRRVPQEEHIGLVVIVSDANPEEFACDHNVIHCNKQVNLETRMYNEIPSAVCTCFVS